MIHLGISAVVLVLIPALLAKPHISDYLRKKKATDNITRVIWEDLESEKELEFGYVYSLSWMENAEVLEKVFYRLGEGEFGEVSFELRNRALYVALDPKRFRNVPVTK